MSLSLLLLIYRVRKKTITNLKGRKERQVREYPETAEKSGLHVALG
jgi:hypothetical protein